jgi:nucleoside-diphosphate-sugar epimerase
MIKTMNGQKRILITGASGFIGGFLVAEALRRGYDVWAGVRSGSSRAHLQNKHIRFIDLPYDDAGALTKQLCEIVATTGRWHYVIHNAGITKSLHSSDFYRINAVYTHRLIESLAEAACKPDKFLLMSSLSACSPTNESSFRPIRLDDEQRPDSVYGKSKLQAEQFVKAQTYFPYVILRPTGVYGPEDKDYLLEIQNIKRGFDFKVGMKPQRITFIYVKDLAASALLALENESAYNRSYFVADGEVYTDEAFAAMIKKLIGRRFVLRLRIPYWICYVACVCSEMVGRIIGQPMTLNTDKYKILKQRNWICETEPTYRALNFIPKYNLKEGLEETIRYNREKGLL